ncbi:formylglycine-generating enzyme family protein [Lutimaribacter marinistellae]|uniref:Formylglycine-generating enzyme family protein n=1 Tax=Lutimaribacter marinistellae TaxID=1820329 RepID=A0ABV7TFY3_9RHOB
MTHDTKSCCQTPPRNQGRSAVKTPATKPVQAVDAVEIPGGRAFVGTNTPELPMDGEGPLRRQRVNPFRIGRTAVTNAQFAEFVDQTGYRTEAERWGWSFVFFAQVPDELGATEGVQGADWWRRIDGATWRDVNGPGTHDAAWKPDHPVVHVSWHDARAYAAWVGGRLPTEAEWEHAARGGLEDVRFPWGDREPDDRQFLPCNIFQGRFPDTNTGADGHVATAPARSFGSNGYGLYNMCGNVWEWTADTFRIRSLRKQAKARMAAMDGYRLSKGGSFLCHKSYCYRYRIAARSGNSPDSTTTHQGFRVVWPVGQGDHGG